MALSLLFYCPSHPAETYFKGSSHICSICDLPHIRFKTHCPYCGDDQEYANLPKHGLKCFKKKVDTFVPDFIVVFVCVGDSSRTFAKLLRLTLTRIIHNIQFYLIKNKNLSNETDLENFIKKINSCSVYPPYQVEVDDQKKNSNRTRTDNLKRVVFVHLFSAETTDPQIQILKSRLQTDYVRSASKEDKKKFSKDCNFKIINKRRKESC